MNNLPSLPVNRRVENSKERAEAIAAQRVLFGHASSLLGNESFLFFLETVVEKRLNQVTSDALDPQKSSAERDMSVQLRIEIEKILCWALDTRSATKKELDAVAAEEQDAADQR
jgi:hypothetical protein